MMGAGLSLKTWQNQSSHMRQQPPGCFPHNWRIGRCRTSANDGAERLARGLQQCLLDAKDAV